MIDVDESQLSPGRLLLQGRLQAGLTQEQAAKDLYMTVAKVRALETDDYGRLISDTFARGYIRAYANLLRLDVEQVLAAYEQMVAQAESTEAQENEVAKPPSSGNANRGFWPFLAVIGAFFLGLWLISVWFFDNHTEPQEVRYVTPPQTNLPKVDEAQVKPLGQTGDGTSAPSASLTASSVSGGAAQGADLSTGVTQKTAATSVLESSGATGVVAAAGSESAPNTSSSKKAGLDEIYFSFRAECWLEVSDSRGDVLATELEAAGSKVRLIGQAPFDVKLGNAPAVDIQLNGKKVDVIPLMGTNVLNMKVGNP